MWPTPFRFGVQLAVEPGSDIRAMAREAEALGYSSVLVPDHLRRQLAPIPVLAVVAEHTSAVRLGTLVLAAELRNPTVLACEAATLHRLSGGRLELGLGAGWLRADFEAARLPFRDARERVDRLRAAIAAIDACFAGGPAGTVTPEGVRPPLLVGGGGRRVLTLAAQAADIVGVNVPLPGGRLTRELGAAATEAQFKKRLDWLRAAAGPRRDQIELNVLVTACRVTGKPAGLRERLADVFGLPPGEAARCPMLLVGSTEELVDLLTARRELLGLSYIVVPWSAAQPLAPVVERLSGR